MKIAVCDDERETRETLKEYINHFCSGTTVTLFDSGERLLKSRENFDIIYLDIKMKGIDGMDTAFALREKGCNAVIVFVTALEEYVYQAFDVKAFNYLVKPIEKVRFFEVLQKAQEQCFEQPFADTADKGKFLLIKRGKNREKIFFADIVYAEIFNRIIVIHTTLKDVEFYGKISDLEAQAGEDFFRPHRAYLINMRYVSKYDDNEIILDKGKALISKRKYSEFVKKYLSFVDKENENE